MIETEGITISNEKKIEKFAEYILEADRIVALTGAGMSTESGIPDFRSPDTGLWTKVDPNEFASINAYIDHPERNLKTMLELGTTIFRAKPHAGHKALTRLQNLGKLDAVLTQNIDGLHQKAKTKNVVEFHGNVNESVCMDCGEVYPITKLINQVVKEGNTPECEDCGGLLKPNAVFFGEMLDSKILSKADEYVALCDLLIILGSSLVVYPVAFYPAKAQSSGSDLAIINIQPTEFDSYAQVVIHEKIGKVLPEIVDTVEEKLNT
ncbi:MAG: SIR2 family NAD-dependent protein deacylase [Promethearchaeia archaeon]